MKKWKQALLASTAGMAMAGSAFAADLPMKAAPVAYVQDVWQGFYVGAHIGAGTQDSTCTPLNSSGSEVGCAGYGFTYYGSGDHRAQSTSALGGVEIGANWQNRSFVYGVAADWSWTGLKGKSLGCSGSCSDEAKVNWLASFRGRAGLAVENTMVYVTGGLALAGVKDTVWQGTPSASTQSHTAVGWVAGAGVEHMFAPGWSVKLEALRYQFSKVDGDEVLLVNGYTSKYQSNHSVDVARIGLNYKIW